MASSADPTREYLETELAKARDALSASQGVTSYTVADQTIVRAEQDRIRITIRDLQRQLINLDVAEAGGTQGQKIPVWN